MVVIDEMDVKQADGVSEIQAKVTNLQSQGVRPAGGCSLRDQTGARLRVLLVGHACGPNLGSEPGFTWNWATHLSAHHDVWLLSHPQRRRETEEALAKGGFDNIHPHWVTVNPRWDPWDPRKGEKRIRLHYMLWQNAALRAARKLHREVGFDVVHHVSWGTIALPPKLWRLGIPFVFGPVGFGQSAPANFKTYFGKSWRKERLREAFVKITTLRPAVRRAILHSDLVLTANRETERMVRRCGAGRAIPMIDGGINEIDIIERAPEAAGDGGITLLWAGRLEYRKGLPLVLEAMAKIKGSRVKLIVAGDGPCRYEWQRTSESLGLAGSVEFRGAVPYLEMKTLFAEADGFVFSSLRDSFGSVVLEAMAKGLPVVTLDHQGVGTFLPDAAAIKVPVTTPAETVAAMAAAFVTLELDGLKRRSMSEAATRFARETLLWSARATQVSGWYKEVVHAHRAL